MAEISLHLPNKPLAIQLFGIPKKIDLAELIETLEKKLADDQNNAWKILCLSALLLKSSTSERKRRVE